MQSPDLMPPLQDMTLAIAAARCSMQDTRHSLLAFAAAPQMQRTGRSDAGAAAVTPNDDAGQQGQVG